MVGFALRLSILRGGYRDAMWGNFLTRINADKLKAD
jgi:hypothetical protein